MVTTKPPLSRKPTAVDVHVGRRIRMRRLILRLSQRDLAAAARVAYQQIQRYENAETQVSAGMLHRLASFMGVSETFFFEGVSGNQYPNLENDEESSVQQLLSTEIGLGLIRAYIAIRKAEVRASIIRLVEKLGASSNRKKRRPRN